MPKAVRARHVGGATDLATTLQLVADTIVESLGFDVAVINLVDSDDDDAMVVAAVSGPEEVRRTLLGLRQGREGWAALIAASEEWGRLRFIDHAKTIADPHDILTWVPDIPVSDDPDAWHPEDALFAPLEAADGTSLGMLSVDMPRDGKRPGTKTLHALEAFAVTASLAIQHATLASQSRQVVRRFQGVFDSSPIAIGLLGPDRCYASVNDAFCRFLGRSRAELVGHDPLEFTHPDDAMVAEPLVAATRSSVPRPRGAQPGPVEKRYLLPDGSVVWGRLHLAALGSADEPDMVIAQLEDITDRKRSEERLVRQAHYDALTSLPNRSQSMGRLREALEADRVLGTMTAVFFCDLDRLKLVNDTHGHAVGDAYIREVARRITESVRDVDVVGRLSGDEFVVILRGVLTPTEAIGLAGRVIDGVRQPLRLAGASFTPSLSLGIAYVAGGAMTADELLAQADTAMYRAKTEERGGWNVYDPSMRNTVVAHLELRTEVPAALAEGQFVLAYQPIVRLSDGEVLGHEALLRWQHPRRGLLGPADFLDVVLDSEFEGPVTDWVLQQACLDAAARKGPQKVGVNVSSVMVGRRDLPDVVRRCLQVSGLDASQLVLELTEDRLLGRSDAPALLAALRDIGVKIAIDDFGSGFSGLDYLQRFPSIDILKLDRTFIAGLDTNPVCAHVVRAMVDLAARCEVDLVTEGVETEEQAQRLRELGVGIAQGFLFGRPELIEPAPTTCRARTA